MVSGLDFGLLNSSRAGPIHRGAAVKTGTRVFADSRTSTPPPSSRRLPRRTRPNRRRGCYLMQLDEGCLWLACRQLWDDGLGWKLDMTGCCCFKMNGPTTENDAGERHPVVRVVHHHGAVAGEERVGSEERRTTPAGNSTAPPPRLVVSVRRPRRRPATPPLRLLDPAAPLSAAHDAGLRALSL
ncbi:hypothetical protein OsI_29113 [Oryza sativa Indica Group]|uniref:Uncharacterized protein n=1 Tax=Oryza sativa subsp. indica TaxID=39946 RepID=B8BAH3_ORYSI|nr:hypothetical protein OsI_29113 [Oryza sativa Indica Group]